MDCFENHLVLEKVLRDLKSQDFSIVDLQSFMGISPPIDAEKIEQGIRSLAKALVVGDPYLPRLYDNSASLDYSISSFNHIGGPSRNSNHPAFSSQTELDLHTDGTLNYLGEVRLSVLGCVTEAQHGGESILFRAGALAKQIMSEERDVLAPFLDQRAMRRHTTIGLDLKYSEGPILKQVGHEVFANYCTTPRDEWRYDVVPGLVEARSAFEAARLDFPNFTFSFLLRSGQVLVMDNARVSHGRLGFTDSAVESRYLLRCLFRHYPGSGA